MDLRVTAALREIGVPFQENEPFSRHTSMGVGGPAAVMAFPRSRGAATDPEDEEGIRRPPSRPGRGLEPRGRRRRPGRAGPQHPRHGPRPGRRRRRRHRRGRGQHDPHRRPLLPGRVARHRERRRDPGLSGGRRRDERRRLRLLDQRRPPGDRRVRRERGATERPPEGWRFHYRGSSIPDGAAVASLRRGPPRGRRRGPRNRDPRAAAPASAEPARRTERGVRVQEPAGGHTPEGSSTPSASRERAGAAPW